MTIVVGAVHCVEVSHSCDGGFRNGHSLEEAGFGVGVESHHAGKCSGKGPESHVNATVVLKGDDFEYAAGIVGHEAVGGSGGSAGDRADAGALVSAAEEGCGHGEKCAGHYVIDD